MGIDACAAACDHRNAECMRTGYGRDVAKNSRFDANSRGTKTGVERSAEPALGVLIELRNVGGGPGGWLQHARPATKIRSVPSLS